MLATGEVLTEWQLTLSPSLPPDPVDSFKWGNAFEGEIQDLGSYRVLSLSTFPSGLASRQFPLSTGTSSSGEKLLKVVEGVKYSARPDRVLHSASRLRQEDCPGI